MKFFVCLLDPAGQGIDPAILRSYDMLPRERGD